MKILKCTQFVTHQKSGPMVRLMDEKGTFAEFVPASSLPLTLSPGETQYHRAAISPNNSIQFGAQVHDESW